MLQGEILYLLINKFKLAVMQGPKQMKAYLSVSLRRLVDFDALYPGVVRASRIGAIVIPVSQNKTNDAFR